tara:strand:- start:9588 stop:10709 length:1122 start_codon:yes stop_codon:yes gene_type:complete
MKPLQTSSELPEPRKQVESMNAYSAPLEGRRDLLRLDFNENTIGPSPLVIEALRNIPPSNISIYPEYNGLKEAIATNLKAQTLLSSEIFPSQIGIFNGVDAAIHSIFHAYGNIGDTLLTTTPTFGYYKPCAQMQGMKMIAIPYESNDFCFPYKEIRNALLKYKPKLLIICNPNNPTGTRIAADKIVELSTISPKTLVVIDELYEAFTGDSILPIVNFNHNPNLLALRSLSKTSGLAGLRIGFAIGNPKIIAHISRVTGPYDINSFAVIAAFAALKDQPYVDNYVKEVLNAKKWMRDQLQLNGIRHHIEGGNYLLIWPKSEPADIAKRLKAKGILVRSMEGKDLLDKSIRVSIGTISQMQLFLKTFNEMDNITI